MQRFRVICCCYLTCDRDASSLVIHSLSNLKVSWLFYRKPSSSQPFPLFISVLSGCCCLFFSFPDISVLSTIHRPLLILFILSTGLRERARARQRKRECVCVCGGGGATPRVKSDSRPFQLYIHLSALLFLYILYFIITTCTGAGRRPGPPCLGCHTVSVSRAPASIYFGVRQTLTGLCESLSQSNGCRRMGGSVGYTHLHTF